MTINTVYKYIGTNGVIVSPCLLPMEYTEMRRLIADSGKELTNGTIYSAVIDIEVADVPNWTEQEARKVENI